MEGGGDEDKELLENLLKSMRSTGTVAEVPIQKKKETSAKSEQVHKTQRKHQDGERSSAPGPCDCGYKHWLEGEEYDYVFQIKTGDGTKKIGYNDSDNPYLVAQNFMAKNRLNEKSLNDTPYISALANAIMDNTREHRTSREESGRPWKKPEEESTGIPFEPYTSSWAVPTSGVHFNKQTNQWEGTTYDEHKKSAEAEEKKRKEMSEEAKKKYQEEKLKKEIEKQRIKDQLRLDKLEREAKRRAEQQKYSAPTPVKTMENGILRVSRSSEDLQRSDNREEDEDKLNDFSSIQRSVSPFDRPFSPVDRDSNSPSPFEYHKPTEKSSGGIRTLSNMHSSSNAESSSDEEEDIETPTSKDDWTLPLMLVKFNQLGKSAFCQALLDSGFTAHETDHLVKFVVVLEAKRQAELKKQQIMAMYAANMSTPEPKNENFRAFTGSGKTLGSTEENNFIYEEPKATPVLPNFEIKLDSSQPVVSIQIRLHNGGKLLGKFNPGHTIQDIRMYIESNASGSNYELMTTFPKKVLADPTQTIQSAGLANAVIVQTPH